MRYGFAALIIVFAFLVFPLSAVAVNLGDEAPALVGTDLDGNEISLAALNAEGKFVFIDFWAKWCGHCRRELPNVAPFYDEFASERYEMIGVSLDDEDTYEEMLEFIAEYGLHFPIIYDIGSYPVINPDGTVDFIRGGGWKNRLGVEWDVHSIPATFLINPDGIVVLTDIRGEDGLALMRKLVEDVPGFLPPKMTMSAALEDGMLVVGTADITSLADGEYEMPFSVAYYVPSEVEGERGEWLGGDYTLYLSRAHDEKGRESLAMSVTPSEENEEEFDVDVSRFYGGDSLYLRFELEAEQEVSIGYFSLSVYSPELDGAISLGSAYARPPEEEPAD